MGGDILPAAFLMTTLQEFIDSLPEAEQVAIRKRTAELIGKVSSGHPELDEAIAEYITARETAQANNCPGITETSGERSGNGGTGTGSR